MSTEHNTEYPVWYECDHPNPDDSAEPKYDCASNVGDCQLVIWDWVNGIRYLAGPKCDGCTLFETDQEEYEATHVTSGEGIDGDTVGPLCKMRDPHIVCKECSEDCGEWVPHQNICLGCDRHEDDEDYGRDPDCGECFRDPTPLTQEQVTAGVWG